MGVKPVFLVLECTTVYPGTKNESIQIIWGFSNEFMDYMDIWAPKTGGSDLEVTPEENNEHDKFVVAIYHYKRVVGHIQKTWINNFISFCHYQVVPSAVRWLANECIEGVLYGLVSYGSVSIYGLEIPVKYKFIGPEKAINWKKTQVNKKVNDIVKKS